MNLLDRFLNRTHFDDYDDFSRNIKVTVPDNFNFAYDVVDEYARLCPDKRALVWANDKGEEKILTFGELKTLSDKAVNILLKNKLKKGDFVMTMLNRRYEYWILAVACHKLGVVIVPATHLLTPKDIAYRCNQAKVKLLFITKETDVLEHVYYALPSCSTLQKVYCTEEAEGYFNLGRELEESPSALPDISRPALNDLMLVYFTSGTTGMPKMVAHNFAYPVGHIMTAAYWQTVADDGLHFTMAETGWAKCSWGKIYGQWIAGSAVFVYDFNGRFTPTDILPLISKYKITTFCAPPTIYRFLVKEDLSKFDFSSLTHCSTAGEALNAEIYNQFKEATGLSIYEGFGQTESTVILATFKYLNPVSGSLGKPSPIYRVEIIDDDENPLGPMQEGEIAILKYPDQFGLVCSYYGDEERTRSLIEDKYYHTGDLAYKDNDGWFWFVGRKDDIIKSSGYRIGPFEVESALHEHPSVLECAITAAPDPLRGQVVKATIVLAPGYTPSDALIKELQDHVKKATAPYKYPRIIEFVKELPKTVSGKIRRVEIRQNDKNRQ